MGNEAELKSRYQMAETYLGLDSVQSIKKGQAIIMGLAIEEDYAPAQEKLAEWYAKGEMLPRDEEQAQYWHKRASDQKEIQKAQKDKKKQNTVIITPLTTSQIYEITKSIISEQLGIDKKEINLDDDYINDLGADSLDIVELVMAFEEKFNIEISDDAAEKLRTVRDSVQYIYSRSQEK